MQESLRKTEILISFAYSMLIALGLSSFAKAIVLYGFGSVGEYPYAVPTFAFLCFASLGMLIALLIWDCIRGRRTHDAILLRVEIILLAALPGALIWSLFFGKVAIPLVRLIRSLF